MSEQMSEQMSETDKVLEELSYELNKIIDDKLNKIKDPDFNLNPKTMQAVAYVRTYENKNKEE